LRRTAESAFELYITILSGSVALLSGALHNLGDVFTTVGVYFGFRASKKPLAVIRHTQAVTGNAPGRADRAPGKGQGRYVARGLSST
jgi:Cation efflux family